MAAASAACLEEFETADGSTNSHCWPGTTGLLHGPDRSADYHELVDQRLSHLEASEAVDTGTDGQSCSAGPSEHPPSDPSRLQQRYVGLETVVGSLNASYEDVGLTSRLTLLSVQETRCG